MTSTDQRTCLRGVNLVKGFGDGAGRKLALREVSVDLCRGQFALLMGPSGSGKSTLLAILSGLLEPDGGQVLTRPRDSETWSDIWTMSAAEREAFRLRHVGFIFQGYNLFPALTARQQLEIVLRWGENVPHRDARRRAEEMLKLLGLSGRGGAMPAQLSGGEKQRVAIGRALVKQPDFLFADEPTSALDWENGQQVVELLRTAAHDRGAAILVVSHDARIVPFVDVAYHLEDGVLTKSASPRPAPPVVPGSPFGLSLRSMP